MPVTMKQASACFSVLTIVMKTKAFTVLANHTILLVSRNAEKTLKNNSKKIVSATNCMEFSPKFGCFHLKFCLRNGKEFGKDFN